MYPLQRRGDWVITQVGSDLVVYDCTAHNLHTLKPEHVVVWGACDGTHTVQQIADHSELDCDTVEQILFQLERATLITLPGLSGSFRPRALDAAKSVPDLMTVAVPSAAAASSSNPASGEYGKSE